MSEPFEKYTLRHREFWKITLGLALASLILFAYLYSLQPILPVFVQEFKHSVTYISLAMSLNMLGLVLGLNILGFLSDRYGRNLFINLSLIGTLFTVILIPFCQNFTYIIILRFIQGFWIAGLHSAALAYIDEEIDPKAVKISISFYIASNALGGMLGRVFTGYVTDIFSWQIAFYCLAALGALSAILTILLLPKSRFFHKSEDLITTDLKAFAYHLRTPNLLVLFGLGVILQIAFSGLWTYLPFYLKDSPYFLSLSAISTLYFAYGLGVISAPIAGFLTTYIKVKNLLLLSLFLLIIGMLTTLSPLFFLVTIGLSLICFAFFIAHAMTATLVSLNAHHHKGTASSLYFVAYYIGAALGSTGLTPLWNSYHWLGIISVPAIGLFIYLIIIIFFSKRIAT